MSEEVKKKSEIKVEIGLDENQLPVKMRWNAEDGDVDNQEAKAMFLALWDGDAKNTMKIDLWVKEMSVEEMKQFFHQTLVSMADTFEKATGETKICEDLRDFCYHFAEKMEVLPEE
jgi:gliding motility-associated protein GldC